MASCIIIPNIRCEERIGSAFNHLFSIMNHCEIADSDIIWDFRNASFLHPFFIAPFAIYQDSLKQSKAISFGNMSFNIQNYLSLIRFFDFLDINNNTELESILQNYKNKSYIPICRFDICNNNLDKMQSIIEKIIISQRNIDAKLRMPVAYLLSELICNIQQHSQARYGYLFSQYLSQDNSLYICLADNGITIYGSYVKSGKYLDIIADNEAKALQLATNGYSTKDRPDAENRGYGISTNSRMIVSGLGGAFFILSGGAFHRIENQNSIFVSLPADLYWNGTIILVKIPLGVKQDFNYLSYIS